MFGKAKLTFYFLSSIIISESNILLIYLRIFLNISKTEGNNLVLKLLDELSQKLHFCMISESAHRKQMQRNFNFICREIFDKRKSILIKSARLFKIRGFVDVFMHLHTFYKYSKSHVNIFVCIFV